MITSTSMFGAIVMLLTLGVLASLLGATNDNHYWSVFGGFLIGSGFACLAVAIIAAGRSND